MPFRKCAVAARLDGGFGVVFQNDRHANNTVDANGPNITYVPVSAAGAVLSPIAVADFNAGAGHDALQIRRSPRSRPDGRLSSSSASGRR